MNKAGLFYQSLLDLYPQPYRKQYGQEMSLLFEDLYQEERVRNREVGLKFWRYLIWDLLVSTWTQHQQYFAKSGFKGYLHSAFPPKTLTFFISILLLLPFALLVAVDMGSLLLTGSREAISFLYDNPFWGPVVLTVVLILPLITVLINGYLLIKAVSKEHYHFLTLNFLSQNFLNLLVFGAGLFTIFMLFGHDFAPCLVNSTLMNGLFNFLNNLNYCQLNA